MFRFGKYLLLSLLILSPLALPSSSSAQIAVGVAIHIGPPALPVYVQPVCPAAGYIWTPGYWAYGDDGYFWVPGTWVLAPTPGYLWTPGYWGWAGGAYFWHGGYWGPHVGFYGGINYGFGYGGVGFVGGEWRGGVYHYNTAVTNVNTTIIHNTYRTTVINNTTVVNRVSFNGGAGGVQARATSAELVAAREHHVAATSIQEQHFQAARGNRALLASENHGHPTVAATGRPGVFSGKEVVAAHGSGPNANRPMNTNNANTHSDRPPTAKYNATTNTNHPPATTTSHPNATQPNTTHTSQPNTSHPNNRPSEPHHEAAHQGGSHGR
jgi:hypothetical protein